MIHYNQATQSAIDRLRLNQPQIVFPPNPTVTHHPSTQQPVNIVNYPPSSGGTFVPSVPPSYTPSAPSSIPTGPLPTPSGLSALKTPASVPMEHKKSEPEPSPTKPLTGKERSIKSLEMMMKGTTDPEQIQRYKEQIEVIKNQPEINIGLAKLSKTPLEEKSEPKQKTLMELLSGHQKKPEEKKEEKNYQKRQRKKY